ncbi:MAG: glycosyltransferase [Bacteroidetes bacterium]|nr:glycosyltransferase [Bacteroidota bacterium]
MKILCITSRVPWPLEKGDKLRAYHQLKNLSKNHEIILCAINDTTLHPDAEKELKKFCKEIHVYNISKIGIFFNLLSGLFSGIPLQVAYFTSSSVKRKIATLISEKKPDRIFAQLIRSAEYAREHKEIPRTLDYMDIFSKGIERRIGKVNILWRWVFKMEWKRLLNYEAAVSTDFDALTIISQQDRDLLPVKNPSLIHVIPNGVDTTFFTPMKSEKDYELLFNGNMNYPPNIESAIYLVKKILPIIRKKKPSIRVLISGASPASEVLALQSENVTVTGWVDDVRKSFERSKILVAPMQSSIGLQNKLLEAMAMKLPCITTTLSNNALKAIPDSQILVADTPEQFATHINLLLDHPEKAERLAENGFKMVHARFNWENTCAELETVILHAGEKK